MKQMKQPRQEVQYNIILMNLSNGSSPSLTILYEKYATSAIYLDIPMHEIDGKITITEENTAAKVIFELQKHLIGEDTWKVINVLIPRNIMFKLNS